MLTTSLSTKYVTVELALHGYIYLKIIACIGNWSCQKYFCLMKSKNVFISLNRFKGFPLHKKCWRVSSIELNNAMSRYIFTVTTVRYRQTLGTCIMLTVCHQFFQYLAQFILNLFQHADDLSAEYYIFSVLYSHIFFFFFKWLFDEVHSCQLYIPPLFIFFYYMCIVYQMNIIFASHYRKSKIVHAINGKAEETYRTQLLFYMVKLKGKIVMT